MDIEGYEIWFEAQPDLGQIVCHRRGLSTGVKTDSIIYTRDGVWPAGRGLSQQGKDSWAQAIGILGWES